VPILSDALFLSTAAIYLVATVLFVASLTGAPKRAGIAPRLVLAGALLHAAHIVVSSMVLHVCPVEGMHFAMSIISVFACVAYLVARAKYRVDGLGALVAPLALAFLLASRVVAAEKDPAVRMKDAILPVHVLVNLLGEAAFTLAFAAAVGYLVQESQLKKKKVGGLFRRLPPLDALDKAEHWCLLVGFPLLTIGILTGTIWARRIEAGSAAELWRFAFSYVTWILFALVLVMRAVAGWRGRRAAYGTIAGFGFAVLVLLLYLVRGASEAAALVSLP
jgi:ABC-type uncharacterized transport system permease subunit